MILVLAIVAGVAGYYGYWLASNYYFQGRGIGCFATGTKGSDFPKTLIEWDVKPRSRIDVGIMLKLGQNPYYPYTYPSFSLGVFIKNAAAYPQPELPEDFIFLFGNVSSAQWITRVTPNASVVPEFPPASSNLLKSTPAFAVDPQYWYSLKILIEGDRHAFFVDGQEIATITAHTEYSKRTAFGVTLASLSYACFGDYYVKSFPTSILFDQSSAICKEATIPLDKT